jgi:hypothetical protein
MGSVMKTVYKEVLGEAGAFHTPTDPGEGDP